MVRGLTGRLGRSAEQLALRHLRRRGLVPVERNFRTRRGEIDLIMLDGACLVFIEVRYRSSSSYVRAMETVDRHKQAKLVAAASQYLSARRQYANHPCRFDIVGIDVDGAGAKSIDWRRDAFRPQ